MPDAIAPEGTTGDALLERISWLSQWSGSWAVVVALDQPPERRVLVSLHEPPRRIIKPGAQPRVVRASGPTLYQAVGKLMVWWYELAVRLREAKETPQAEVAEGA